MAARFPSGPPMKPATDPTLVSVPSTGKGGYPGADAGKKGGPRVDAGKKADAGKKDGSPNEEGTLREVLAAVTSLAAKVETQGHEMDALRQELGNGMPRVATQHGAGPVARHGVSMFGDARDAPAGNVRSFAGAAPLLGSMKPRAAPKEYEAGPAAWRKIPDPWCDGDAPKMFWDLPNMGGNRKSSSEHSHDGKKGH